MTFNYNKAASTALKLLSKFGRTIQHIAVVEGTYNPATGTVTNVETSTNLTACDFAMKDNSYSMDLVQAGDRRAIFTTNLLVNVSDKLVIDGVTWSIYLVKKLAPSGINILFECYIRK